MSAQRGQAMAEYLVVLALVIGIFAMPVGGGEPLIVRFATALGSGFARFLSAISLPL